MNPSLPTKEQWKKVAVAAIFSFVSTFLSVFMSAGGIQNTQEATITLALSALVAATNATLYAVYTALFKAPEK